VVGLVCVALLVPSASTRFSDLENVNYELVGWNVPQNSLAWRVGYWKQIISLTTRERPTTGLGIDMISHDLPDRLQAHNDYVRAYGEGGLLGLLGYLTLVGAMLSTALHAFRSATSGPARALAAGFVACVVSFILMSATDNVISQVVLLWYFSAFAAVAVGAARLDGAPISAAR
jgi:O-antigen ligase